MAKVPGLIKGLGITFGTMMRTFKSGSNTVQYPHEKETTLFPYTTLFRDRKSVV